MHTQLKGLLTNPHIKFELENEIVLKMFSNLGDRSWPAGLSFGEVGTVLDSQSGQLMFESQDLRDHVSQATSKYQTSVR